MTYHLDVCTPETWKAFLRAGANVTGFRKPYLRKAQRQVKEGDIFLCYMTGLSRWCGALEVETGPFLDDTPRSDNPDPFIVRFKVKPMVLLCPKLAIPIREPRVWQTLTITKERDMNGSQWTWFFRAPLNTFERSDGDFLLDLLNEQKQNQSEYMLSEKDKRKLVP